MDLGRLALRITIGSLFIGHGTQKLFGWFGGSGLEGTDTMMAAVDMRPVRRNAIIAGVTEAGCGVLLVLGLATPLAAAGLTSVMVTAVRKVHWKNGPWNSNRGWELNAVNVAGLTALVDAGPGRLSLDAARGRIHAGAGWALAALTVGIVSSAVAIKLGERASTSPDNPPEPAPSPNRGPTP